MKRALNRVVSGSGTDARAQMSEAATSTKTVSKSGDAHVVTVATGDRATVGHEGPSPAH